MAAMFEFLEGGIGVMPDPEDNPDGHVVPHHDAGVKLSFEIQNVGEHAGIARAGVEVDDQFAMEWTSEQIEPGEGAAGFASVGRLNEGTHTFLVYVNPGSGGNDHATARLLQSSAPSSSPSSRASRRRQDPTRKRSVSSLLSSFA